jgi:hypothetical protein
MVQSESVVNSGPAIFISPTGPNPMMVQVSTPGACGERFDGVGVIARVLRI